MSHTRDEKQVIVTWSGTGKNRGSSEYKGKTYYKFGVAGIEVTTSSSYLAERLDAEIKKHEEVTIAAKLIARGYSVTAYLEYVAWSPDV